MVMGGQQSKSMAATVIVEVPSFLPPPTFSVWSKILNPLISSTVPHYRIEGKILVKREEFDRWL